MQREGQMRGGFPFSIIIITDFLFSGENPWQKQGKHSAGVLWRLKTRRKEWKARLFEARSLITTYGLEMVKDGKEGDSVLVVLYCLYSSKGKQQKRHQ